MSGALPRAAVVLSGNELLDGRTRDTNGAFLSAELSARGVKVTSVLTVADDADRLTAALEYSLAAAPDLLVVGGGLGTTHDDLTAACLARALGVELREDSPLSACSRSGCAGSRSAVTSSSTRCSGWPVVRPCCRRERVPCRLPAWRPGSPRRRGTTRIYAYPGVPCEFEAMWHS